MTANTLRLKSLELSGFKTFASRTYFEFAGSVTAIVGPNGSGKSNIADALRWVLGEQSFGLLRGRKTEDMIFAGSEKRARAGMASATVTFDNSIGWLPIDYGEVSITRRAYRDGQNEYLINQQKVRLKDVTELLAQSALAERTYTVIGQGLVDTALTLKSDERRRLFEEAAGIGLYRSRKEQAQRRLEATRRNLERVEDILAELKPRLRSLERQAKRASEYAQLRSDLRESLRVWYGYQWHRRQNELRAVREEAVEREENLGLARQKQSELNKELNLLRNRTQELRIQLNGWHRRLAELHASRESSGRELAVANERQRSLNERSAALDEERQRLETELGTLEVRLKEAQRRKERAEKELSASEEKLVGIQQEFGERLAQEQARRAKAGALGEALDEVRNKVVSQQAQRQESVARQARDRQELKALESALQHLNTEIEAAQEEVLGRKKELEQSERELQDVESVLEEAKRNQADTLAQLQELEKVHANLLREQSRMRAELSGLEEADWAATGFAQGAKWLLETARAKRLKLKRGTLGRELQLPQEYEAAIAAALGHYLEAVFVEDEADPEAVLRTLEDEDASATLLPLKALSVDGRIAAGKAKGVLGVAADLVDAPKELRPALDLLLGRVLVVEDRAAARRVLENLPDNARAVTLRGEVFHRGGQIEVRSSQAGTPLARERKERELRSQLQGVERELAEVEEQIAGIEKNVSAGEQVQREIKQRRELAYREIDPARQQVLAANLEIEQLQRQRDWFQVQKRNLERQIEEASAQIAAQENEEKALKVRQAEVQQALEAQADAASELPLEEDRAQIAHWEMRVAVSQRALQEVEQRLDEQQQLTQKAKEQLASFEARQAELAEQKADIEKQKGLLNTDEGQFGEEITSVQSQIGPAEEELHGAELQLQGLVNAEEGALKALTQAERAHTQAQIALARQQESLSTLRNRIEDDFGLVAFEYDEAVSGPTPLPLGDLVERLPVVENVEPDLESNLKEQRAQLRRLGSVNPEAQEEYSAVSERFEHLQTQVADLEAAEKDLNEVIAELDVLMEREFRSTFDIVAAEFRGIFSRLFNGGAARLLLTDEEDLSNTGIDIEARLPGKRSQRLALLSGGERSLTAAALVFALLKASPTPFCVMDEVDAMLDEANIGRFTDLLGELSRDTQFVLITHNRNTVQAADVIYGVTMGRDTASQVISLKLDEVDERFSE